MREEQIWKDMIRYLSHELDEETLDRWFHPLRLKAVQNQTLLIESPNSFISDWVKKNFRLQLGSAATAALGKEMMVEFEINPKLGETKEERRKEEAEKKGKDSVSGAGAFLLNPKYTFENFVVGRSNQLAYAACRAVAEREARNYNPLFIYGGVGLGKTHLLTAVGNQLYERNPRVKIICIQAEAFLNEMIQALRQEKMDSFRRRFRKECDVLLMDDIEIIAGKERTQEEFFYTFNDLYQAGKKIVMTSDKFPREMTTLEERLRSRFESGIIVDIQPPEYETRLSIIKHLATVQGFILPDEITAYIAERITSNIRSLEGCLIRLAAVSSLTGAPPSLEMAQSVIQAIMTGPEATLSAEDIMKIVAAYFKIKISDLKSPKRNRKYTIPRQIAIYLCRELCSMSYPEIGAAFGNRDHSTIIHSCRKIGTLKNMDQELNRHLESLMRQLKAML